MRLEGEIRVDLRLDGGRIVGVDIASTRPDVAVAMLRGRRREAVDATLPLLFSVCGRSQSVAGKLAWAVAAGETLDAATLARGASSVSAEILRESACRILLEWPRWLGETPGDEALAAARGALEPSTDLLASGAGAAVALAVFGCGADEWIDQDPLPGFDRWLESGPSVAARFLRAERDADAASPVRHRPDVALVDGDALARDSSPRSETAGLDFAAGGPPNWHGLPAETGALARLRDEPMIDAIVHRSVTRQPARHTARLLELAQLLAGRHRPRLGTWTLPSGAAVAWVENARGLLMHEVRVEDDVARDYRIVAPTDWNFHPQGALFAALSDTPADDPVEAERRARRIVRSLDPCVECRIGVHHA